MERNEDYSPIRDYAAVGDCHGVALVSLSGRVDWCALGRFDAPPVFCRILDAKRGGYLDTAPTTSFHARREYLPGTNILRTTLVTQAGEVALTDFMPVGRKRGSRVHDYTNLQAPGLLVRRIACLTGSVELDIAFRPSIDYAAKPAILHGDGRSVHVSHGPALHSALRFTIDADVARARIELAAGQRVDLVVSGSSTAEMPALDRVLEVTEAFWREWIGYCRYRGPYRDAVERSALALKMLTYTPTGAIVAAATTSLPERIGGERNWDYRYCWLRDTTFTLHALAILGYSGEARAFLRYMHLVCAKSPSILQIMYAIDGEAQLPEATLPHLEGYRRSRPVRVGNAAHTQRQADVYGEFVDGAHVMAGLGAHLGREFRETLELAVSLVLERWREPDQGVWETRTAPRHYVHGKLMSWAALDRGIAMLGERREWCEAREQLRREIFAHGIDAAGGHLVQAFGSDAIDASLLVAPFLGFPLGDAVFARTVQRVEDHLRDGDFVARYRTEDGLHGREGAFLICSFWLVDAYLWLGRGREATELFERLLVRANDVGLYAEQIDADDGSFLGNFPQAFTHLGLIGAAINLDLVAKHGREALAGTGADRARRAVGATFGWKALWEAARTSGRVGRVLSSRASMMPRP